MRAAIVLLSCGLLGSMACGSDPSTEPAFAAEPAASESSGSESPLPPPTAEPVQDTETRATGPASVTVRALVDGKEVPARIRVLESGAESDSGSPISLPSGAHRIELQVTDAAAMADTPKQVREVFLEPGKNTLVEATFPWARVQLNVLVGGRSQPGTPVKLLRDGAIVAEMKGGAPPTAITPGKYEADVLLKGTTIRVTGLQFPASATQTVPVRVQF